MADAQYHLCSCSTCSMFTDDEGCQYQAAHESCKATRQELELRGQAEYDAKVALGEQVGRLEQERNAAQLACDHDGRLERETRARVQAEQRLDEALRALKFYAQPIGGGLKRNSRLAALERDNGQRAQAALLGVPD
jgi:hypothetical protein